MIWFFYIALASVLVPVFRDDGFYGFEPAKERMLLLLTAAAASFGLALGLPPSGGEPLLLLVLLCGALTVSTLTGGNKSAGPVDNLLLWWGCAFFYWAATAVPPLFLAQALFLPSIFVAGYGLMNQFFRRDWFHKQVDEHLRTKGKKTSCVSFIGNTNHLSAYLTPCFFLGIYCAVEASLWYAAGLVPVTLAIGITYCRAGWLATIAGLGAGLCLTAPLAALIAIGLLGLCAVICLKRIESTVGRWYYLREAWIMFQKRPLAGWGCGGFRRNHFRVQAEINEKDPSVLGTPDQPGVIGFPVAEHSHNEYAELAVSGGVLSLGLFLGFAGCILWGAASVHPVVFAGCVAAFVHAAFFYNLTLAASILPFFGLCAMGGAGFAGSVPVTVPWYAALAGLLLLAAVANRCVLRPFLAGRHFNRSCTEQKPQRQIEAIGRCIDLDYLPRGTVLYQATLAWLRKDLVPATLYAQKLLDLYDGEKIEYFCWDLYGRVMQLNGAHFLAKHAFRRALDLNPAHKPSIEGYISTCRVIDRIRKAIHDQGSQLEGQADQRPEHLQDLVR